MLERINPTVFQDKIEWLWEKVKSQEFMFDDTLRGDHRPFLITLFRPDTEHWYNEHGMVSVVDIQPKVNANVHFLVWDTRTSPYEVLKEAKVLFEDLFDRYELSRLTATIPTMNKAAVRFATLLGMRFEGTMREAFLYREVYHDLHIYGLLKREFKMHQRERVRVN